MSRVNPFFATVLVAFATLCAGTASAQSVADRSNFSFQPSDNSFDFEVYVAEQIVPAYHVKVRLPDGSWEYEIH